MAAVHIINRLPTKATGNKVPFEILTGKKARYGHLRTIGCLAYAHDLTNSDKFEVRGRRSSLAIQSAKRVIEYLIWRGRRYVYQGTLPSLRNNFPLGSNGRRELGSSVELG